MSSHPAVPSLIAAFKRVSRISFILVVLFCFWISGNAYSAPSSVNVPALNIIDVMVLYTPQARAAAGTAEQLKAQIRLAVSEANIVFENSRAQARIRLVHVAELPYDESFSIFMDLNRLRLPDDGYLDDAHQLRNVSKADLVCLVTEYGNDYAFYGFQGPSPRKAFSAIRRRYLTGGFLLPVTLSVNLGCQLERPYADSAAAFLYSYGYSFRGLDGQPYSTVDGFSGSRLPWFSNPDINFAGMATGLQAGEVNAADNTRTINNTAPIVAKFRGEAPRTLPPVVHFTTPLENTSFARTNTILLQVEASDPDGSIARVDFFLSAAATEQWIYVGSAIQEPFTFAVSGWFIGDWRLRAQAVDNLGATASVESRITVTNVPPVNDSFADAITLTGTNRFIQGWTVGATLEEGEPNWGGDSVWYSWTAPLTGRLRLSMPDWPYGTVFTALTGSAVSNLTKVADNLAWFGWNTAIEFEVFAGTKCKIAVAGSAGALSQFTLTLIFQPAMVVRLTDPREGTRYPFGAPIHLAADATTVPGEIVTRIEFRADGIQIGATTNPPFDCFWTNATAGSHVLTARAFDSAGTTRDSPPIGIIVSPVNDNFANAATLAGSQIFVPGSTSGATLETGEPLHSDVEQAASVWWRWTAPSSGRANFAVIGPAVFMAIGIHTGPSLAELTRIGSARAGGFGIWPSVEINVESGQTFYIAVAGFPWLGLSAEGPFTFNISFAPTPTPPGNDCFQASVPLSGNSLSVTSSTVAATGEIGEPNHAGQIASHSVWWNWTAPQNGNVEMTVVGNGFTPVVDVYTGTAFSNFTILASAANGSVSFRASVGTVYQIAIDGLNGGAGSYTFRLQMGPANDDFTNRIALSGISLVITGANIGGSREVGEPIHGSIVGGKSVWWTWTAPVSGCVSLDPRDTSFETSVAVYRGDELTNLLRIASGSAPFYGPLRLNVTEGDAFQIAVEGVDRGSGPATGAVVLHFEEIPVPPNDNFANRAVISGTNIALRVTNTCASIETNEPALPLGAQSTVWWNWTSPAAGSVTVHAISCVANGGIASVGVFSGNALGSLTAVGGSRTEWLCFGSGNAVSFSAPAGATFQIVAGTREPGEFILWLVHSVPPANDRFVNRIILSGTNVTIPCSNSGAGIEPLEPIHSVLEANHTVWYSWTAPAKGRLRVEAFNSNFIPFWAAYVGGSVGQLARVATSDTSSFPDLVPAIGSFPVQNGTHYQVVVDALQSSYTVQDGDFDLKLTFYPQPANDDFEQAFVLAGSSASATGSTAGASRQPGEPQHHSEAGPATLWWQWTAPFTGDVALNVSASETPTFVAAYSGTALTNLTSLGSGTSSFLFRAEAGTIYHFAIGQQSGIEGGNVSLNLSASSLFLAAPTNGQVFYSPTNVQMVAEAADEDGPFNQIDFLVDGIAIASVTNRPFTALWNDAPSGSHTLFLRGFKTSGEVQQTAPVTVTIRPANDDFAGRQRISETALSVRGNNSGATVEPAEPRWWVFQSSQTIWWNWTAPADGVATISFGGTNFSTTLAVFTGDQITNLVLIQSSREPFSLPVAAGVTYQIAMDGLYGASGPMGWQLEFSTFRLVSPTDGAVFSSSVPIQLSASVTEFDGPIERVEFYSGTTLLGMVNSAPFQMYWTNTLTGTFTIQAKAINASGAVHFSQSANIRVRLDNDDFSARAIIPSDAIMVRGKNIGATTEANEPFHGFTTYASVWWTWTAPLSGRLMISTLGSSFNPLLAVYSGEALPSLVLITNKPAIWSGPLTDSVALVVEAGKSYQIAVAGIGTTTGDIQLNFNVTPPPENDNFNGRWVLSGTNASSSVSILAATKEPDEPAHGGRPGGHSVWWTWTALKSGSVTLTTNPNGFAPVLAIYSGTSLTNLTPVGSALSGTLVFDAVANSTFQIVLDADTPVAEPNGNVELHLFYTPAPSNNDFGNRAFLAGYHTTATGTTLAADEEQGEPLHSTGEGGHSIWYTWVAPESGIARLSATSATFSPVVGAYIGESVNQLTLIASEAGSNVTFVVSNGLAYQFAIDVDSGAPGPVLIDLGIITVPPNDNFADRKQIIRGSDTLFSRNELCTIEAGEFLPAASSGRTAWWMWTAPSNGVLSITSTGSSFPVLVSIYVGEVISNLTLVASNSYVTAGPPHHLLAGANLVEGLLPPGPGSVRWNVRDAIAFQTTAGTTYQISVDGLSGTFGDIVLSFSFSPFVPPINNDFANRTYLTGEAASITLSNTWATREPSEPDHAGISGGSSVWWAWIARTNGRVRVDTSGSSFPALVAAYTGESIVDLVEIASGRTLIEFQAVAGQDYQIAVDGDNGTNGSVTLSLKFYPPPPNDDFANSTAIAGPSFSVIGYNVGATQEPGEPNYSATQTHHSVWWTWTAPVSGRANIAVASSFPSAVSVYTGTTLNTLSDQIHGASPVFFLAQAGTQYHFLIDAQDGTEGDLNLTLSVVQPATNDQFANRTLLSGNNVLVSGSIVNATRELGEELLPESASGASVWYSWTAPSSGPATILLADGSRGLPFGLYAGSGLSSLLRIGQAPSASRYYGINFYACAGVTYQIAVADDGGAEGDFGFRISGPSLPPTISVADRSSENGFPSRITGNNGQSFAIEASSDLQHWTILTIDTLFGTWEEFLDSDAKTLPHRFYRVRPLEALFSPAHLSVATETFVSNSSFSVRILGRPGEPFKLESSEDLEIWTERSRGILVGESEQFIDLTSYAENHRFYRAIPLR
jgi:hypothetical protein